MGTAEQNVMSILQELKVAGAADGLRAIGNTQLAIDVVDMLFDSTDRNHQVIGNGLIRVSRCQQTQNFKLPLAERFNEQLIGIGTGCLVIHLAAHRTQQLGNITWVSPARQTQ